MRFMMIMKADKNSEAGKGPDPKLMDAIGKLVEEHMKAGVLVSTGGLTPSSSAIRITAAGGKLGQVDGPYAETKELIAGYAIFDLKSPEEAIEYARRFMKLHVEILGPSYEGTCEIRPMHGMTNFAASCQ
jgi:hypothetical protein